MRALVANDPRVYREVITDALRKLRPLIEVSATEPEELDREVGRLRPHLVRRRALLAGVGVNELLSVVDETELRRRSEKTRVSARSALWAPGGGSRSLGEGAKGNRRRNLLRENYPFP